MAGTLWTIGHSTRSLDEFIAVLQAHDIRALADVRRFPASRRYPHFNRTSLAERLQAAGVQYHWLPELGGRRNPRADSRNTAWRNRSFRGYADYMETAAFQDAMATLQSLAVASATAIMCAEALWWRCHRALIADYLAAHGARVIHIVDVHHSESHRYTDAARVVDGALSYADPQGMT